MDSLKTLIVVAVLGAVSYAVYVSLNRNPDRRADLDAAPQWTGAGTDQTAAPPAGQLPQVNITAGSLPDASGTEPASYSTPLGSAAGERMPPTYRAPLADAQTGTSDFAANANPRYGAAAPLHFEPYMQAVREQLDEGKLPEAHLLLSSLYDDPRLSPPQYREVTDLLLQLAGTVIYSNQHHLEPPYTVRPGETIEQIAADHNVPPQLLSRINLIRDGQQPQAGTQLKVIRGPFSAVVHLERYELVLMLNDRFAGRISIGRGRDLPLANIEGEFRVQAKTHNPAYNGRDTFIAAGDENNPLGKMLLDLGGQVALHGTNDPNSIGRYEGRGTIRMANSDMEDLFRILSVGSEVKIRR